MKVLKWWAWFLLLSSPYHSTSANRGTYTQTDTDIESLNVKSSLCCCHRSCVGWRVHIRVAPGMALMGRDWGSTIGAVDLAGTISFFNPWTLASLVSIASTSPPMHPDQPAAIYATGFYLLFCFRHVSFMPFPSFFFPLDKFVFFKPVFFCDLLSSSTVLWSVSQKPHGGMFWNCEFISTSRCSPVRWNTPQLLHVCSRACLKHEGKPDEHGTRKACYKHIHK